MTKLEFSDAVYKMLHTMRAYDVRTLRHLVGTNAAPNERALPYTLDVIKDFIQFDNGRNAGFYVELSEDHSRFIKKPY